MIVCKKHILQNKFAQRGASVLETIMAVAVVLAASPFVYNQIADMSNDVKDMAMASKIVSLRDSVVNYLRVNQDQWPDVAEIKISDENLEKIAPFAHSGFIDKYKVNGASVTDVYLAFNIDNSDYRGANIAKYIGEDAATVREDGIAYSQSWAVSAPEDFYVGDLIFRISRDFDGADQSKFLHRGTMGEDGLNKMQRDLHMNNFNVFNVSTIDGLSAKIFDVDAVFVNSAIVDADVVYFSAGANMQSPNVSVGSMRVVGDTNGFRTITANKLNGEKYSMNGKLVVDSATVGNSVSVSNNLILKSSSAKSISGFDAISANVLLTPYLSATNLLFYENFGLTVSGELLTTGKAALQIGSWLFPTTTPPSFSKLILTRASLPAVPEINDFKKLTDKDWQL